MTDTDAAQITHSPLCPLHGQGEVLGQSVCPHCDLIHRAAADADLAAKSWERTADDAVRRLFDAQGAEWMQRVAAESAQRQLHQALHLVDDLVDQIEYWRGAAERAATTRNEFWLKIDALHDQLDRVRLERDDALRALVDLDDGPVETVRFVDAPEDGDV